LQGRAGLSVHEEHIDRSYNSGTIGFMERWSRKKEIERRKNSGSPSPLKWLWGRRKTKKSD
jgi:hypothetical protein